VDQEFVDNIVNQVINLLLERAIADASKKHVLMLFSGAGSGYKVGMQAIQWLAKAGHTLTVVMTSSARHVIGEECVRKAGAERIIGDNEWVNTPKLVSEIDLVLMPTLSMNTASHLALGLMDSLISTLVLGAVFAEKPVIAISDGADPYGNGGRVFGKSSESAPVLRAKISDYLETLKCFGIHMVKEDAFLFSLVQCLGSNFLQSQMTKSNVLNHYSPSAQAKVGATNSAASIITAADLLGYPPGSVVHLTPGARLTPLAQETVFRQVLSLVYD